MEFKIINLSEQALLLINGPLIVLNLTANIFYACCLIFPPCHTQRLKEPLNKLLGCHVWCSIIYFVSLPLMYILLINEKIMNMFIIFWMILLFYVHNSMTCSAWLSFYYYTQIVPSQRAPLIWVKRNIRSVIYVALLLDGIFFLFNDAVAVVNMIQSYSGLTYINATWTDNGRSNMFFITTFCFLIVKVYILICLCIMMISSFSIVHYLHRHIKSMAQDGSCFSSSKIQSQKRVTINGLIQGVFYLVYVIFYFIDSFTFVFSMHFSFSSWVSYTVTSLYISATTVNLGIGQTTFRQRAVDVWRALKARCGVGMVTNDVTMHSSHLTSGGIPNTVDVQMSL